MPSVSSTGQWGGSGCRRVKAVLILLVLLYLAKEALLDDAEAIPTTGGEGSRHSEGEYKVLLSKGTDRLFSSTTQTFSMVRERKRVRRRRKVGPERRLLSLPALFSAKPLFIPKRGSQNISFECPTTKCNSNDCVVVFPVFLSKGLWAWNVYPETGYQRVSQRMVRITLNTVANVPPEMWCFTKEQLKDDPMCTTWTPNYKDPSAGVTRCSFSEPGSDVIKSPESDVDSSKNALITPPKQTQTNSAMSLMLDYAHERKVSNCWLCQNMPESMYSPMFSPIPFTKADYSLVTWSDIASRISKDADDCYTPSYPIDFEQPLKYNGLISLIVDTVNKDYLPDGFKRLRVLKLIYVKKYVELAFEYRFQLALVQTNCSATSTSPTCSPQPHTPSLLVEALVAVVPWFGVRTVDSVKVKIHDCSLPLPLGKSPTRDCSVYVPPVVVHEWKNVSICFQSGGGFSPSNDVGHSDCNTVVKIKLTRTPLPERVYLVCGNRAYGCMPYDTFDGTCYLAYLIPLIRKVETEEIAAIFPALHRTRRTITTGQRLASAFLPWYGIYVSQQEIIALSKVVEKHLNVSNTAMLAEHKELQEVRTVALQNRMALDLLLAAQGGTCKVIGSECCSFISDATPEVMDMAHDTARGIKELHETHGFAFGDLTGTFGSWGGGIVKFIVTISVFILGVLILIICLVTVVKLVLRKITKVALQAPQRLVGYTTVDDTVMMYDAELPDPWVAAVVSEPWVPPYNDQ
ncbi:uncharacterized protein LOC117497720 [Trematomus bernacchii]|uniref:uncharacterized protein LOC117497720 n=1 Tax=Trematomus bernacchii TaxID=40690 RepID=UPI00146B3E6B|nr:uncharacterized protein LOC117497720 [Trematomus bernacchii]